MIRFELYKIFTKRLFSIGLVLVLFISFIMFKMRTPNGELYNYVTPKRLDDSGDIILEHEYNYEQPIATTYRERVREIKKTTAPFVGKELNNKLIEDMWRAYYNSDTPVLYNSLDETPFDGFLYHFIDFDTPEYLESKGYGSKEYVSLISSWSIISHYPRRNGI